MKNRFLALLLILVNIFICTSINIYAEEDDGSDDSYIDTDYDTDYFSPGVEVDPNPVLKMSSDGILSFAKGEERDVEVLIKNVSPFYAYNILIQPVASGGNIPYTVEVLDKSNVKYYLQNTTTMKLKLHITVDKDAKSGVYPLTLNYAFSANNKTNFTGQDTIYIKVEGESANTSVTMKDFERSADRIAPGENALLSAELVNDGNCDAKNVTVVLSGLTAEAIGMENGSSTYSFASFEKGKTERLTFNIVANSDIKDGSYPLAYKLSYDNGEGERVEKEFGYYVNVSATGVSGNAKADLTVTASEPMGTYSVGQKLSVKLTVKNTGDNNASNIVITAKGDEENAVVPRSTSVKHIKSLEVNAEESIVFDFAPTAQASTQNYPIGFEIEYETGGKTEEGPEIRKFTQYSGVNVYNPEKEEEAEGEDGEKKASTPKIIISRYECNPVIVEAGKNFDIDMTFKNTHSLKAVKNIKLYLTVDEETEKKGNVFTPDKASNTFYIDEIKPKGEVSHTFSMYTVPDADARTYTLNVNFEYEDSEYNEYKTTELVGINVKQKSELTTNDIIVPTDGFSGEGMNIVFDMYNTGKVTLSNVMVRVVGEGFNTAEATYYAGTLEAGASDTFDGTIIPVNVGTSSGQIIISYEDSTGEKYEKIQDFTVNVSEPMPIEEGFEDMSEPMPEEDNGSKVPLFVGIGVGAIVIIIIIVITVKTIHRRRRERELSE